MVFSRHVTPNPWASLVLHLLSLQLVTAAQDGTPDLALNEIFLISPSL